MKRKNLFLLIASSIIVTSLSSIALIKNVDEINNKPDATLNKASTPEWLDSCDEPTDYDYSFAVVGDIQNISYFYPEKVHTIYDYIVDNIESKKIAHVFTLGDITESNAQREWDVAKEAIGKLDGKVRYSLVRGNHDGKQGFLDKFGNNSEYKKQYKASYLSSLNTAVEFSAGNLDYLIVNLDYRPSDEILTWANSVVEAHPNHNVIMTTHGYMDSNGQKYDADGGNGGTAIWEKFVSKHSNIVMTLSGHVDDEVLEAVKNTGVNGNVVTELLIDPQRTDLLYDGGTGLVAMLYFSNGGSHVDLRYYSTIRNQYYKAENQISFDVETVSKITP